MDYGGDRAARQTTEPPPYPWWWLTPSLTVLGLLAVWGAAAYPRLPERVPQHLGTHGVEAYAAKSIGAVFAPVFVYAGVVLLLAGLAAALLRVRPASELAPGEAVSGLVTRPATRTGADRVAKASLFLALCVGVTIGGACGVMWQTGPWQDPPEWGFAVLTAPSLLGVLPLLVVALWDKRPLSARRVPERFPTQRG